MHMRKVIWIIIVGGLLLSGCHLREMERNNQTKIGLVQVVLPLADTATARAVGAWFHTIDTMQALQVYRWQNRYVLYTDNVLAKQYATQLKQRFPKVLVELSQAPIYAFDRTCCWADTATVSETDHIVLSANLVADTHLQSAYLDYHKHQFEQWPEVAQGFCRAQFQQVWLYKMGRQLLLVINIPKGADFASLNKKTTENNPRVDEWNRLMAQYQEGLPGTKKGEVWVFFEMMNDE